MDHASMPTPDTHIPDGDGCRSGRRNRYFPGKRMRAEAFALDQRYLIERRRLINRGVLGWGVVSGFQLALAGGKPAAAPPQATATAAAPATDQVRPTGDTDAEGSPLRVGRGLALDAMGREIVLECPVDLTAENTMGLFESPGGGGWRGEPITGLPAGRYLLAVHYAERFTGDVVPPSPCGCGEPERSELCEGAMFSLRRLDDAQDDCPCGAPACPVSPACVSSDACSCPGNRGPHAQLCAWSTGRPLADPPPPLQACHGHAIAWDEPVDLAWLTVSAHERRCDPLRVRCIDDPCGPRRIVKTNDLLYDLIRGCDLTTIAEISWADWHRSPNPVPWTDFRAKLLPGGDVEETDGVTDLWVRFSRPVRTATLQPHAVTVTCHVKETPKEKKGYWRLSRRVPIAELLWTPKSAPLADKFYIRVSKKWAKEHMEACGDSILTHASFGVEIEIRGDLILDCNGQAVDANARGPAAVRFGNGSPGGTCLSTFTVEAMPKEEAPRDDDV